MTALALALLSHVDGALRRALLGGSARKVLMQSLWRGLASDAVPDICAVLGAFRDHVLATSSGVPPRLQAAVLTDAAIDALVTISASAAPEAGAGHVDGQQAPLTMADAKRHADAILTALVMDPAHGFVPDTLATAASPGTTAGPAAHRSLSRVLRVLRRLRVTEVPHHCEMVLAACEARPQLAGAYLGEPPYGLEPRASAKWMAAITMTSRLIRTAVTSHHLLAWTAAPSTAAAGAAASSLCRCLFPAVLTRGALTRALGADAAPVVRYAAVLTLLACLRSMGDVMQATRQRLSTSSNSVPAAAAWLLFREAVRDAARDALPDPQTLVALILSDSSGAGAGGDEQMANAPPMVQAGGTKRKRGVDADADADHDGDDARGIENEPAPPDLRAQAMRALAHFRRLVPGAFSPGGAASRLDPTRLLPSVGGSTTLAGAWQQVQSLDEADVAASLDVMLAFTLGSGDVAHGDQEDGAAADQLAGDDDAAAGLGSGGSGRDTAPGHVAMLAFLVQRHGDGHVPDDVAALSERLLRLRCVAACATLPAASLAAEEAQALLWIRALPPASCPGSAAVTSFFAEAVAACARRAAQQHGEAMAGHDGLCPLAIVALDSALKVGASAKRGFVDRLAVCCYVACAATAMMAAQADVVGVAGGVCQALRSLDQVDGDAHAPHGVAPFAPLMALRRSAAALCGSVAEEDEDSSDVARADLLEAALKAHRKARKSRASGDMAGDAGDGQLQSAVVLATLLTCSAHDLRTAPLRLITRAAAAVGTTSLVWAMQAMPHVPLLDAAASSEEGDSVVGLAMGDDHMSLFALLPACAGAACEVGEPLAQALCAAAGRVPPLLRQPAVNALCSWLERARTASAAKAMLAACVALVFGCGDAAGGVHGVHWAAAHAALSHPRLCGRYLHSYLGDSTAAAAMTQATAAVNAATDAGTTELIAAVFSALDAASAPHSSRLLAVQAAAEACACRVARALCVAADGTAPSTALHGAAVALFARMPAEEQHAALQVLVPERLQASNGRHMSEEWRALGATLAEQAILRSPGAHVVAGTVATWRGMLAAAQALPGGAAEGAAVRVAASWPAACVVTSTATLFASCLADPTAHGGAAARAIAALCSSSVAHQSALCASLVDADAPHWRSVALPLLSAMTCVLQAAASQPAPSADAQALAARLQPLLMAHFGVDGSDEAAIEADGAAAQALRSHGHPALVATLSLAPPAKAVRQQLADALLPSHPHGWLRPDDAAAASPAELCSLAFALARGDGALKKAKELRVRSLHVAMATATHLWSCGDDADASLEVTLMDALAAHVQWASREPGALVEPVLALCRVVLRHRSSVPAACDLATAYVTQLATQRVDQPAWATGVRRLFDECVGDDALLTILQNAAAAPPQLPAAARRCAVPLQSLLPLLDAMEGDAVQSAPADDAADSQLARERKRSVAVLLAALLNAGATEAAPLAAPWVPGQASAGGFLSLSRKLLCCYYATCDPADVAVYHLVRLLDTDGSTAASLGHLWGAAAEYALRVNGAAPAVSSDLVGLALREIAPPDARRAGLAALAASVWPPAANSESDDDVVSDAPPLCVHAYDSRVILPAAAQWLATGAMNVRDACAWGLLPLALACLSCGDATTRGASYAVLAAASEALQRGVGAGVSSQAAGSVVSVFREQPQVGALLFAVRNAVSAPLHLFPGSAAVFAAEACCVALHPEARLYSRASRAVLKSEALDLECLPLVAPLLHSGDADTWKADSLDACRLVRAYVRTATDGDLARRAFILESLMALVTSSMADANIAREGMQALTACLRVATYAVHGVDHSGIVPWLARLIATSTDAALATTAARALVDVLMVHPGIRLRAGDALAGVFWQAAAALERRATDSSVPAGDVLACAAMRMYRHLLACRLEVQHQGGDDASVEKHAAVQVPFPRLLALLHTLPATVAADALCLVTDTVPPPTWRCGPADAAAYAGVVCWAVKAAGQVQKADNSQRILAWAALWLAHASLGAALAASGHARDVALALLDLHTAMPPSLRHAPDSAAPLVTSLAALAQAVGVPDAYAAMLAEAQGEAVAIALSGLMSFWSGSSALDDALDALRTWQARADSAPGGDAGHATAGRLLALLGGSHGRKTLGKRSRGNVQ